MSDDHETALIAHGADNRIGVVDERESVVITGEVGGDDVVPASAELGLDQVPRPAHVATAVDQDEGLRAQVLGHDAAAQCGGSIAIAPMWPTLGVSDRARPLRTHCRLGGSDGRNSRTQQVVHR